MHPQTEAYLPVSMTVEAFKRAFFHNLASVQGKDSSSATPNDTYQALAYTVRDQLIERWLMTLHTQAAARAKTVYYMSAEYLMGRQLDNNLLNTGLTNIARQALAELGLDLNALRELEDEPGLGNGGLGRLAACYLDSLATLQIPCVGYGIRYEFGIFKQVFQDGWQVEQPDSWLDHGDPWEFPHLDHAVEIGFGGRSEAYVDEQGRSRVRWLPERTVLGIPYNMLVPGYQTSTVNTLRLWRARASRSFDLQIFNTGDYTRAVADKTFSENITKVLYPDDTTPQGKQLRLEQQYFFVACSLRDILRVPPTSDAEWEQLPERIVIQLNDTHPSIAVAELMRLLVDQHLLSWERAWAIAERTFAFTNHTLLPEALERWPVSLFAQLLPRHLEIIYEINRRFLAAVQARFPGDVARLARLSLIDEGAEHHVRMANLACLGSFSINGVAELHSQLVREQLFRDFAELWPERFNNKTNGVTPRRFMRLANPRLAELISSQIGAGWLRDCQQLAKLEPLADDAAFRAAWRAVKQQNKRTLADLIRAQTGVIVDPHSLFDIMVKRLHEYKRQLLKVLHCIALFNRLKADPASEIVPRTVIFGAKAAPGYHMAKLIIKLINAVADLINHDPDVRDRLKIVFVPNFNVALAERIYPAADLSEQISLAGKEASGTGNMKFALNGALTIGTLDGANIEIRDLVGAENFFLFGLTAEQVAQQKLAGYHPQPYVERSPALTQAIVRIAAGDFAGGDRALFKPIVDSLLNDDPYMLCADFQAYAEQQDAAECVYQDAERWDRMAILNVARCGFFSSDRAVQQYCDEIWQAHPVEIAKIAPDVGQNGGNAVNGQLLADDLNISTKKRKTKSKKPRQE